MKCIIICEIDEETLLNSKIDNDIELLKSSVTLESIIEKEMGWVEQSGIYTKKVLLEDSFNDFNIKKI